MIFRRPFPLFFRFSWRLNNGEQLKGCVLYSFLTTTKHYADVDRPSVEVMVLSLN